jgi:hypothetical protein
MIGGIAVSDHPVDIGNPPRAILTYHIERDQLGRGVCLNLERSEIRFVAFTRFHNLTITVAVENSVSFGIANSTTPAVEPVLEPENWALSLAGEASAVWLGLFITVLDCVPQPCAHPGERATAWVDGEPVPSEWNLALFFAAPFASRTRVEKFPAARRLAIGVLLTTV